MAEARIGKAYSSPLLKNLGPHTYNTSGLLYSYLSIHASAPEKLPDETLPQGRKLLTAAEPKVK